MTNVVISTFTAVILHFAEPRHNKFDTNISFKLIESTNTGYVTAVTDGQRSRQQKSVIIVV